MLSKKPIYTFLAITCLLALIILLLEYYKVVTKKVSPQTDTAASYIGDEKCQSCHSKKHSLWKQSDHFKAVMPANDSMVVGDFSDVSLAADGVNSAGSQGQRPRAAGPPAKSGKALPQRVGHPTN